MKLPNLRSSFRSMYFWAILFLLIQDAFAVYFNKNLAIPVNLFASITVACVLEVLLKKFYVAIPLLLTLSIFTYFTGYLNPSSISTDGILNYFFSFPYYFAFIMVSEPKTSPYKKKEQIVFGIGTALLLATFTSGLCIPY